MLRQGPENWTSKEYRGSSDFGFRVFQCFTRPKWHSSRRCGKSCRDEALGTWAGPCWTMLGPRTLIWLKNIEKPQLYVEEQPDVDLETWIMFGCPTMRWSFSFGTWSWKMILQDPVSETTSFYTISIHIQLWAHPNSIFHISLQGKQTTDSRWHSTTLAPICAAYWDLWNFYWSSSFLFNVISIDLEEILTCSKCPSAMISREPVCHPYYGRWTGGLHNSFSGAFNTS